MRAHNSSLISKLKHAFSSSLIDLSDDMLRSKLWGRSIFSYNCILIFLFQDRSASNAPLPGIPPPIIRKPRSHTVATEAPPPGLDLSFRSGSDRTDVRSFSSSAESEPPGSLNDSGRHQSTSPLGSRIKAPPPLSVKPKPLTETGQSATDSTIPFKFD